MTSGSVTMQDLVKINWQKPVITKISSGKDPFFDLPVSSPDTLADSQSTKQASYLNQLTSRFSNTNVTKVLEEMGRYSDKNWEKASQQRALALFQQVAQRVPAYRDFLRRNNIKAAKVKTWKDFLQVPVTDKDNYFRRYPLAAVSWDGQLANQQIIAMSSGSSGEPFFWPRSGLLEIETTYIHELIFRCIFEANQQRTLVVNLFSMGMYVGGPLTLNVMLRIAQKGYPLSIITPGLDVHDALAGINHVMDNYDQVVFIGYPPFIKDVIDLGKQQGTKWEKVRIRFLLGGEGFSEAWRDHLADIIDQQDTITEDIINFYGATETAVIGHETPLSIALRRHVGENQERRNRLFTIGDADRIPTLTQYIPTLKYIENVGEELIVTSPAGVPLVRYNTHDRGGTVPYTEALVRADMVEPVENQWKLPFVYLYGKSDYTISFYGLNIYPEHIRRGLENKSIQRQVSGRFVVSIQENARSRDHYLMIKVELAPSVKEKKELKKKIEDELYVTLRAVNFEYNKLCSSIGSKKARPRVKLYAHSSAPTLFNRTGKQRWRI